MNKFNMFFDVPSVGDCNQIRIWRNKVQETLRTPYPLSYEMQVDFYNNVICNRKSNHRYYSVYVDILKDEKETNKIASCGPILVGLAGLINIEFENGIAEISLLIGPKYSKLGYGREALEMLLKKGFNELRLENIYGECYKCNKNIVFWEKVIKEKNLTTAILPNRKFYNGYYYDSLYFNINSLDLDN